MNPSEAADSVVRDRLSSRRHSPILRSIVPLVVTAAAVTAFILALGDHRRRHIAMTEMQAYAARLQDRVGKVGVLPLNLEPGRENGASARSYRVEWLSREEVNTLRENPERVMVARTVRIPQSLARDGRAVMFFWNGRFDVEWLGLSRPDRMMAAQRGAPGASNGRP